MAEEPNDMQRQGEESRDSKSDTVEAAAIAALLPDAAEPNENEGADGDAAPPPLAAGGPSQLPPASPAIIEAMAAAVERLRAEVAATMDGSRKARLLYEAGEIQERGGDERGAAREYLAAYNADTSFREPLEGLMRLLERRRSLANLGKLIEALVASAVTPEERARALTQRAIFVEDVQSDLEGARGAAREATESGAGPADLGAALLTLELVAAKLGDHAQREEALAGRAEGTLDPTWRGLLLLDVAGLAAQAGDVERALAVLSRARAEGGAATYAATRAAERLVHAEPGLPGSDEARARARAHAEALEARAELIARAMEDPERGEALGVPRTCRSIEHLVDLWLRAAESRRVAHEIGAAARVLDRALAAIDEQPPARDEDRNGLERLVTSARLRVAETMGDTAVAAALAARRMDDETEGRLLASLALRVAEHAASEGETARAMSALARATECDPASAPARALKIDVVDIDTEPATLATELEDLAAQLNVAPARARTLLLASYVWAARAGDGARARQALVRAEEHGIGKEIATRLGRSLASLTGDEAWYEEATERLVECAPAAELPLLWVELARVRAAQADVPGAARALASVGEQPEGEWLARVLSAFTPAPRPGASLGPDEASRARAALEELAANAVDPALRRGLRVVCAMRAHAAGDHASTVAHLRELVAEDPRDPLVAVYLGELLRSAGDRAGAAALARTTAEAMQDDPAFAAARHLEAGIECWRLGDRSAALASFEAAAEAAPQAAQPVLAWAARGLGPSSAEGAGAERTSTQELVLADDSDVGVDTLERRRRALDLAGIEPAAALERFALEAALGDASEAGAALATLDDLAERATPALTLAGALGYLAWPDAGRDPERRAAALARLAATGGRGERAAAAEKLRAWRDDGGHARGIAVAATEWLDTGGGRAAAVEWLAATLAGQETASEVSARRQIGDLLDGASREALQASATLLEALARGSTAAPLLSDSARAPRASRLADLELAPPGCEPTRRATVLANLGDSLGADTELDALGFAAWSMLAGGNAEAALEAFHVVTNSRPDDLHAWEGMRSAAEVLEDHEVYAVACEQLGARCVNDPRGAAFWEQAGFAWLKLGAGFEDRGEAAFEASFIRDATRARAFEILFRRVRERRDGEKLLGIVERRLAVCEDPQEIAKLYWEQARVLREKGDPDGALEALGHVRLLDENHVGALALTGEILIRRGQFAEAAESLARLARIDAAPPKNRVTAGVAAVDLYENKLGRHDLALEVLVGLHEAKLTTLPVRERLARAAARTGAWAEATRILEQLMQERSEPEGRIEAARLAIAIYRDRLHAPQKAVAAITKILDEAPADAEALDLAVALDAGTGRHRSLLERGRDALLRALDESPSDLDKHQRLARVAHTLGDPTLEQAALSSALALGGPDGSSEQMIVLLSSRKPRTPHVALTPAMLEHVLAPGDDGPLADLFMALGPTLAEALGPQLDALGVAKRRDRVDPRSGLALRNEIAAWAGAFGITAFDLYVGGKDPSTVQGVPGDMPALVVGSGVNAPLSPMTRARVARELLAMARGTTVTRWRDDTTIAAIVVAACNIAKVHVEAPAFAVLAEVERLMARALSRKTRAAIEPICRAVVQAKADARVWAARARASHARAAVLASGDVAIALGDVFGEAPPRLCELARDDLRAHELLRFVLSRPYLELRRALGLEG